MPLEIKELHIKATVSDENSDNLRNNNGTDSSSGSNEKIVAMCVERVLQIFNDKLER